MDIKESIIQSAIVLFNRDGFEFKMDDLARSLHISKKTIYKYFTNKEGLFRVFINDSFQSVHDQQKTIYADASMSIKEKLMAILNARSKYEDLISVDKTFGIKEYYPSLFQIVIDTYSTQWELVTKLLQEGIEKGIFRSDINITLVEEMFISCMTMAHNETVFKGTNLTYRQIIYSSTKVIVDGISK